MFTRRFQKSEKNNIGRIYKDNPLFSAILYSCQIYENQTINLRLSPEEIFFEVTDVIDKLLLSDFPDEEIENLWDVLTANLRRNDTSVPEAEIHLAVAIVLDCVFVILRLAHYDETNQFADEIIDIVHHRYSNYNTLEQNIIDKMCNYSELLCPWIEEYLSNDISLSSQISDVIEASATRGGFLRSDRDTSFILTSLYSLQQAEENIYNELFSAKNKADAIRRIYSLQNQQVLNIDGLINDEVRAATLNKYQTRFTFTADDLKAERSRLRRLRKH